jgi:hypothetical protein
VFVPRSKLEEIVSVAMGIGTTERKQADDLRAGRTLQEQLRFDECLALRSADPSYTFRAHLRKIGGAIEA